MLEIIKEPFFENDDMLIKIKNFSLNYADLCKILDNDKYIKTKFNKFKDKDIRVKGFDLNRPSFRHLVDVDDLLNPPLKGSIYTYSVKDRNGITYEECIEKIQRMLIINNKTRKAVIRMANSVSEYELGETYNNDVSCLNLIHYYSGAGLNEVKLIFRASDIKNELFADLITIYWFFIKPVFNISDITIYASTAQYIYNIEEFKYKLNNIGKNGKE